MYKVPDSFSFSKNFKTFFSQTIQVEKKIVEIHSPTKFAFAQTLILVPNCNLKKFLQKWSKVWVDNDPGNELLCFIKSILIEKY